MSYSPFFSSVAVPSFCGKDFFSVTNCGFAATLSKTWKLSKRITWLAAGVVSVWLHARATSPTTYDRVTLPSEIRTFSFSIIDAFSPDSGSGGCVIFPDKLCKVCDEWIDVVSDRVCSSILLLGEATAFGCGGGCGLGGTGGMAVELRFGLSALLSGPS